MLEINPFCLNVVRVLFLQSTHRESLGLNKSLDLCLDVGIFWYFNANISCDDEYCRVKHSEAYHFSQLE